MLAHLDYHFDACNDFTSAEDVERLLRAGGAASLLRQCSLPLLLR